MEPGRPRRLVSCWETTYSPQHSEYLPRITPLCPTNDEYLPGKTPPSPARHPNPQDPEPICLPPLPPLTPPFPPRPLAYTARLTKFPTRSPKEMKPDVPEENEDHILKQNDLCHSGSRSGSPSSSAKAAPTSSSPPALCLLAYQLYNRATKPKKKQAEVQTALDRTSDNAPSSPTAENAPTQTRIPHLPIPAQTRPGTRLPPDRHLLPQRRRPRKSPHRLQRRQNLPRRRPRQSRSRHQNLSSPTTPTRPSPSAKPTSPSPPSPSTATTSPPPAKK